MSAKWFNSSMDRDLGRDTLCAELGLFMFSANMKRKADGTQDHGSPKSARLDFSDSDDDLLSRAVEDVDKARGYICDVCGKVLKTAKSLRQHALIHTATKHTCDLCAATFSRSDNLTVHQRKKHGITKPKIPKSLLCAVCNKSFANSWNLKVHRNKVHGKRQPMRHTRFQCPHCSEVFYNYADVFSHVDNQHPLNQSGGRRVPTPKTLPNTSDQTIKENQPPENQPPENQRERHNETALHGSIQNQKVFPREGGILSNSLALFTDVLHLGSDLISFLVSLLAIYLSKKPATRNMSFGYHRTEVLGALFSVFIIWMVTGVLVYMAVERIQHEHYKTVKPDEMLITASIGVAFNLIMGVVLHSDVCFRMSSAGTAFGHLHSHSKPKKHRPLASQETGKNSYEMFPSDKESQDTPKHQKNINVRAAFIHVVGDIVQSLGVLVAALVIKLKPEEKYKLADPICTFLFSFLVLLTTITVLRDTLHIIMEGVPRDVQYNEVKQSLQKLEGVKAVHDLTVWSLTADKNALAVHLAVDPSLNHQLVLHEATAALRRDFRFIRTTIQVENHVPDAMTKCSSCTELEK